MVSSFHAIALRGTDGWFKLQDELVEAVREGGFEAELVQARKSDQITLQARLFILGIYLQFMKVLSCLWLRYKCLSNVELELH